MRIQETDKVLKESRHARHAAQQQQHHEGLLMRAWRVVSGIFKKR